PSNGSLCEVSVDGDGGMSDVGGRGFTGCGIGLAIGLVGSIVLDLGCTFLGKGVANEVMVEGFV
ncbi:hypothetical protein KI387_003361, partial [Taxus chinensis]